MESCSLCVFIKLYYILFTWSIILLEITSVKIGQMCNVGDGC